MEKDMENYTPSYGELQMNHSRDEAQRQLKRTNKILGWVLNKLSTILNDNEDDCDDAEEIIERIEEIFNKDSVDRWFKNYTNTTERDSRLAEISEQMAQLEKERRSLTAKPIKNKYPTYSVGDKIAVHIETDDDDEDEDNNVYKCRILRVNHMKGIYPNDLDYTVSCRDFDTAFDVKRQDIICRWNDYVAPPESEYPDYTPNIRPNY